jgi:L-ribulose-5-phosphate 3-epimerase
MLNIGARAHDYCTSGIEDTAEIISAHNFSRIQLALTKSINDFDGKLGQITPGFGNHIRKTLAKNEISIAVLGCYINLTHPDEAKRTVLFDYFKEHLRYVKDFGASLVGTETGSLNVDYSFNIDNHSDHALEIVIENIAELVSTAEKFGSIVGIEAVTKHVVNSPVRMKKVIEEIKSDNLQVIFDPVNLIDEENYLNQERIVNLAFELFGEKIVIIHSKDFLIENGKMVTVETGKGLFNYKHLLKILKQSKPQIDILLENSKPQTVHESIDYLKSIYNEI